MSIFHWLVGGASAIGMSAAAGAQTVRTIEVGQAISENEGTASDFYRFGARSGTMVRATLTAPGSAALVLYSPAGEEMISVNGTGVIKLEALIPLDDVFYLSVFRQNRSKPYSLKFEGEYPEPAVAHWSRFVGFDSYDRATGKRKSLDAGLTRA